MSARRKPRRIIVAGAIGEDIHVAGIFNFLNLAEQYGYRTSFLGAALSPRELVGAIREADPYIVGVSYRLSPESGSYHLASLKNALREAGLLERKYAFGGTPPVAKVARDMGIFEAVFDGTEPVDDVISYLRTQERAGPASESYPSTLVDRIEWKRPYPVIRHHFGLPSLEETFRGIRRIAESKTVDIISIAPDQDAQENLFHPDRQDPQRKGAGGVPLRTRDDFVELYSATRCGNHPLLRCYQGTSDLFEMAEMLVETIRNCFAAIPLFWFSRLDKRGPLALEEAIRVHQELMRWHGERDIPVELNEPHHWELRSSSDTIAVAVEFLSAYNAKRMGVRHYVGTRMFNLPPGESFLMDLAKQLAKKDITQSLVDDDFTIHTQTRTGLLSYPSDMSEAKGHLASSVMQQMALGPEIVHVVGYCEADHAATPEDVVESCKIARRVISNCIRGLPDVTLDPRVQARKEELLAEAGTLLEAIRSLADEDVKDPWTDPATLKRAVETGLLDAPHLKGNEYAKGSIQTRMIDGACYAVDPKTAHKMPERERIRRVQRDIS